ncbi:type I-C CRISPR-associated protein Cas8c/Csd1 [Desulfovibrio subterraneus]|uniref:type I-C CRISPR-associated protein Cas8c/Csd1 n=1 Tax=Desulfovibrio subterraneus TaxID=2718620 RepID=UPI0022B85B72|nr:type I-C CRISPR-associated protein Cas8c/Csd1 [Desulfovibrio subterraneus]WBF68509.1 type I-C CRISPR-associated protein Cas8c/Csd1 [Desulfovibrio subterraneus]
MILSALTDYYRRMSTVPNSGMPEPGYMRQRITHLVEISEQGDFLRIIPLGESTKTGPSGHISMIPWTLEAACRTSGKVAFALADKPKYSLGAEGSKTTLEHAGEFHTIVTRLVKETKDAGILALRRFLERWQPETALGWEDWEQVSAGTVAFRLAGDDCFIHERPLFRDYWHTHWPEWSQEDPPHTAQCLVTGERQTVVRLHQPIKGVAGAQSSGGSLVSFNIPSFTSYGKSQSYNAPVCEEAAFAYTTALNMLLAKNSGHSLRIGDATTIFWADSPKAEAAVRIMMLPMEDEEDDHASENEKDTPPASRGEDAKTVQEVRALLGMLRSGRPVSVTEAFTDTQLLQSQFYILGLGPNKARIAVRFWYTGSIKKLAERVAEHYAAIAIETQHDKQPELPTINQLLATTARMLKDKTGTYKPDYDSIPPLLGSGLARSVLNGTRYPESFFSAVLSRIRTDKQITYLRAAVLKGCLLRNHPETAGGLGMSLDETRTDVPYLLGRLFAVLEKAQRDALGLDINATIRDRFFGAAAATPVVVFPQLIRLAQHHIKKADYGHMIDRKIQEIMQGISTFPSRLTLPEQGVFAIGYYHQKNANYAKSTKE